jgi:hypothetical protein
MLTPWRNSNQRYSPENATYTGKVIIEQGQWTDLHMYILTKKIGKNEYNFFLTLQFCEGIKKLASSWYVQTNSHIHRKLPSNKTSVEIRTNSHLHTYTENSRRTHICVRLEPGVAQKDCFQGDQIGRIVVYTLGVFFTLGSFLKIKEVYTYICSSNLWTTIC